MLKRIFDIVVSIKVLLVLSPILMLIIIAQIYFHGFPIFFQQKRPGLNTIPFNFLKFRTMTNEVDEKGVLLPDSQRLTKFGSFLRNTSLDEFPSLLNVIKGDMSLVGPRPLLMDYVSLYNDFQARRHEVKPGITGWAQINGRNSIEWEKKFELDIWYVENQNFLLDVKILFLTLIKVLKRDGISEKGEATVKRFKGTNI